jgi:hypothetical protein
MESRIRNELVRCTLLQLRRGRTRLRTSFALGRPVPSIGVSGSEEEWTDLFLYKTASRYTMLDDGLIGSFHWAVYSRSFEQYPFPFRDASVLEGCP